MAFTARVFRLIEAELHRTLSFPFTIVENLTRPGSSRIRPGESFAVRVWVRNDSTIPMMNLRGAIHPTPLTSFPVTTFHVAKLEGREQVEIAEVVARVLSVPQRGLDLDQLATVDLSVRADMSQFAFEDRGRALVYAQPTARGARASGTTYRPEGGLPGSDGRRGLWSNVRSLPLSPDTGDV